MKPGFAPKYCPRCGSKVYLDSDIYGWYEHCLQCGYTCDLKSVVVMKESVSKDESLPRTAR